jgi:hypothetical protein
MFVCFWVWHGAIIFGIMDGLSAQRFAKVKALHLVALK